MKPINVSVRVERPRHEVFAFLEVLGNHAPFTDHMLTDWTCAGPAAGIGARTRMRANTPGPKQWIDMEVVSSAPPTTIVEEAVSANGRRRTRGTYRLAELPGPATEVQFELVHLATPPAERLAAPLLHAWLHRANARAMRRLGDTLGRPAGAAAPSMAGSSAVGSTGAGDERDGNPPTVGISGRPFGA